jgi:hypothetical protein
MAVPEKGAPQWLGFLSDEMRSCDKYSVSVRKIAARLNQPASDIESTFVAANLTALLLFRSRQRDEARDICDRAIAFALAHRSHQRWPEFALLALQPEVNLLRIDGYAGDLATASEGLRQLDQLSSGRPAEFGAFALDGATIDAIRRRGFDLPGFARNVLVAETCKIFWRRGRPQALLPLCAGFERRWPDLILAGGPAHAREAPWLIGVQAEPATTAGTASGAGLAGLPVRLRRAEYVCRLHAAAHLALSGQAEMARQSCLEMLGCRARLRGSFVSPVTPIRWDAALADTLIRCGMAEEARGLIVSALNRLAGYSDPALQQGLYERACLAGAEPGQPQPADPGSAAAELSRQRRRLAGRLSEQVKAGR